MPKRLSVITNPDLGWDCVVAVIEEPITKEQKKIIEYRGYVIHDEQVFSIDDFILDYCDAA